MATVWVLVTDSDDFGIVATLHRTEAKAYECLRANFLDEEVAVGVRHDYLQFAMEKYQPDVTWAITEEFLP